MAAVLNELLLPQAILDVISRIEHGRGPIGSWLGFHPNRFNKNTVSLEGPNVLRDPAGVRGGGSLRYYTYRIFDHTRTTLKLRAPGAAAGTIAQTPMGQNTVIVARFYNYIPLNYEFLGNLSPMIGPNSQIDAGGQSYITQMEEKLAEKGFNTIEVLAAGMLRDSLYMIQTGDDWWPQFAAPTGSQVGFQIPFQVPSGNKGQLNMLGSGNILTVSWLNPAALIQSNCEQIKAAYVQLSGARMTDALINSTLWPAITGNTQLRNAAGTANTPFAEYTMEADRGMDGGVAPAATFRATLKALPWLRFHLIDDVVVLNSDIDVSYSTAPAAANVQKLVPDNMAIFATEPNPGWTRLVEGGEYVVENEGMPGALRTGWYAWHQYVANPSQILLFCLLNTIPVLYRPNVVCPATVVF